MAQRPNDRGRHKIQFDVSDELWLEVQQVIPWGCRRLIYEALTQTIVDYIREVGPAEAVGQLTTYGTGVRELMERQKNGLNNS
jgi:hypothetical protein